MNIQELVIRADKFNRDEMNKYNSEIESLYDLALETGIKLAKKLNADENIVRIAISMMDSKLPEASSNGNPKQHKLMAVEATENLLKEVNVLSYEQKQNLIKCIEEHHGVDKFYSIESEIVCNADCYKFIHPKGVFDYCSILGRRFNNLNKELEQLEYKMDEKYNAMTLEIVKNELAPYYNSFKELISKTKE